MPKQGPTGAFDRIVAAFKSLDPSEQHADFIQHEANLLATISGLNDEKPPNRFRKSSRATYAEEKRQVREAAMKLASLIEALHDPTITAISDQVRYRITGSIVASVGGEDLITERIAPEFDIDFVNRWPIQLRAFADAAKRADVSQAPEASGPPQQGRVTFVQRRLADMYFKITGEAPTATVTGRFYALVTAVQSAMEIDAKPAGMAKQGATWFREKYPRK